MHKLSFLLLLLPFLNACASSSTDGEPYTRSSWVGSVSHDEISGKRRSLALLLLDSSDFSNDPSSIGVTCEGNRDLYFNILSEGFWGGDYNPGNRKVWFRIDDVVYETRYLHDVEGDAAWLILAEEPRYAAKNADAILKDLLSAEQVSVRVMDWRGAVHTASASNIGGPDKFLEVLRECGRA